MPARPLRPGETPPKGTAIIRGYVTALTTGTPLRRAQVRAMSMDGTGGDGVTSTDAEGRFEIRELPAGRYSVTAMNNAMVRPDGSFEFTNVAPGRYNLNARPMQMQDPSSEFAVVPLTVGNDDLDNVLVTTSVGGTAHGAILTDDGSAPSFRADQVQLSATSPEPMLMVPGSTTNKVNDDFSFVLSGLFDRRLIRGFVPGGWYLKGVFLDGNDVTDRGIDFVPGRAVEGLEVVFTQKATDLSGLVMDDRNRAVVDASVVIFPANRERWTYSTRFLRTLRPDTQGRYNIKALPPGEDYLIIAVQGLEQGQGGDPEFLARASEEAKPFTLNEGETKSVDVKLSKLTP